MDGILPNFPQEQKHSHFVVILSIFVVIVLAFLAYVIYMYRSTPSFVVEQEIPLIQQRVTLTSEQAMEKQRIIEGTDDSRVTLTKKEAEIKKLKIKQASEI